MHFFFFWRVDWLYRVEKWLLELRYCFHPGWYIFASLEWAGGDSFLSGKNSAGCRASPVWLSIRKMNAKGSSAVPLLALVGRQRADVGRPRAICSMTPWLFVKTHTWTHQTDTCMQVCTHVPTHLDWDKTAWECQPSSCEQTLNWAASAGSVWIVLSTISANLSLKQGGSTDNKKTHSTLRIQKFLWVFLLLLIIKHADKSAAKEGKHF